MKLNESLEKIQINLAEVDNSEFDRLNFSWGDLEYFAKREHIGQSSIIHLKAHLGYLYYTAENPEMRVQAIRAMNEINKTLGTNVYISPKGQVSFESKTEVSASKLGNELISALTVILLSIQEQINGLRPLLKAA